MAKKKTKLEGEWFSAAQVAEIYGITKEGVRYWISRGLKFKKKKVVGKKPFRVFLREDVEDFIVTVLGGDRG